MARQISIKVEKTIHVSSLAGFKDNKSVFAHAGVDLVFGEDDVPLKPAISKIICHQLDKGMVYLIGSSKGPISTGLVPGLVIAVVSAWALTAIWLTPEIGLQPMFLLAVMPLGASLAAFLWFLNLGSKSIRITVTGKQVEIEERALLGKDLDTLEIADLESITSDAFRDDQSEWDIGHLVFEFKSRPPLKIQYSLDKRDLTWLIYRLNVEAFGASNKPKPV